MVHMKITVILCTHNRCRSLSHALESVAATTFSDPVEWEVVVVDNNSKDQTRDVIEDYCRRYPGRFRYVFEPHQGLSHARNAGIREARGDVLAFMDDDVRVEPTWLQNLTAALDKGEWVGAGGRTVPANTFTLPDWLALDGSYSMMGILYAHFDLGDKARELDRAPYGANMAYRKEMFEKYGGFRTDLGRCAGSMLSNEDTEFGRRLIAGKERLRYEPSAVVYHPAPDSRIQKEYFLTWWFEYGQALVREWGRGPAVLGIPRPYLKILQLGTIVMAQRMGRWILTLNPRRRFYYKCLVWLTAGEIREYYRLTRSTQAKGRLNP